MHHRDFIINGIDAVIVTHLHLDHWDDIAKEVLPKEIKLFGFHKAPNVKT